MSTIVGQTALLTGASGGLGRPLTLALLQEGATVVGVARSATKLAQLQTELSDRFIPIAADLAEISTLDTLVQQIQTKVGTVDILINNAGLEIYRAFTDYSPAEMQAVLNVNLLAAMELARLLLPAMQQQQRGHIVNIASLAAKKGHPYDSLYSASKAGLLMWNDALRQELSPGGVQVSVICPGYISGAGMMATTGVPAPPLSGTSTPEQVARSVVQAIRHNRAESLINQNKFTASMTHVLLVLWQLLPRLGDAMYRWMGVNQLNQSRIPSHSNSSSSESSSAVSVFSALEELNVRCPHEY